MQQHHHHHQSQHFCQRARSEARTCKEIEHHYCATFVSEDRKVMSSRLRDFCHSVKTFNARFDSSTLAEQNRSVKPERSCLMPPIPDLPFSCRRSCWYWRVYWNVRTMHWFHWLGKFWNIKFVVTTIIIIQFQNIRANLLRSHEEYTESRNFLRLICNLSLYLRSCSAHAVVQVIIGDPSWLQCCEPICLLILVVLGIITVVVFVNRCHGGVVRLGDEIGDTVCEIFLFLCRRVNFYDSDDQI